VVLATFHGISKIARYDMDNWGEYWRFTTLSASKLFSEIFPKDEVTVQACGNVFSAIAFFTAGMKKSWPGVRCGSGL
jgi:hypothetical protein